MAMKAFLSYAHADGSLVAAVANKVGRPFVHVDEITFHAGDELLASMERAVSDATVFVLFASRASLDSVWVSFEAEQARYLRAVRRIKKVLVVLLDDRLSAGDLPPWLRETKYLRSRSPGPIARAIRSLIDDLVQEDQHSLFVGRAEETASVQAALVSPDLGKPTSLIAICGLPGIGRRTLLARVAKDTLAYARVLTVIVEPGDNINALAIKLADLVEGAASADEAIALAREIEQAPEDVATKRFISSLEKASKLHELVALYDEGGLLEDRGGPVASFLPALTAVGARDDLLLALVTNRRPFLALGSTDIEVPVVDVRPLREEESRQLLALQARSRGLSLEPADLRKLAQQVRGYPPSATAMTLMVGAYGVALALGNTDSQYQPRPLNRYLRQLRLSRAERNILRVLAANSPLPIDTLLKLSGAAREEAIGALTNLIDASVVAPRAGTSWYEISEPVVAYVDREYPPCSVEEYATIADELSKTLEEDRSGGPYLDLARTFYRSLVRAGRSLQPRAYALLSDWLRLAADLYHHRDYEQALQYATLAHEQGGPSEALQWVVKCNVKLGDYPAATDRIAELRRQGEVREAHFLTGFLERHRGEHRKAINAYELARSAGRGGLALERDLADCYLEVNDLERAEARIKAAQDRQPDNPYVVSLRIKIACRTGDETTARELLPLLHEVDEPAFANHRHSRVELAFGDAETAYDYARRAVQSTDRPPFEALANLCVCELRTNRLEDGKTSLTRLSKLYKSQRPNVQGGLQARVAIIERRYEDALGHLAGLDATGSPEHLALKRDALRGILDTSFVAHGVRQQHQSEIDRIESVLSARPNPNLWVIGPD